jgi:hypothetical protein
VPGVVEIRDTTGAVVAEVAPSARELVIHRSTDLEDPWVDLRPLDGHRYLRRIVVRCIEDPVVSGAAELPGRLDALVWLEVRRRIRNPEVVPGLSGLRVLDAGVGAVPSLAEWSALRRLERLGVAVDSLRAEPGERDWFPTLPRLSTLDLRGKLGNDVAVLATATPGLRSLWAHAVPARLFRGFGELTQLEELRLFTDSTATGVYTRLQNLRTLGLRQPVRSLAFLADMNLEEFLLWSSIRDQALLALPDSLVSLSLSSPRLRKLDWVSRVPHLRELFFHHCVGLGDLRPLLHLQELEEIDFFACRGLEYASVLAELPALKRLTLHRNALADPEELEWLARMRPELEISALPRPDVTPVRELAGFDL